MFCSHSPRITWVVLTGLVALNLAACQPEDTTSTDSTNTPAATTDVVEQQPSTGDETLTNQQAVTDQNGPNYMVLGGPYVDLVGEDGEPDKLAGRLVNGGTGVTTGSANENVWLLLGPTGKLTYLDEDGRPLRGELLNVLENNGVLFSSLGERNIPNIGVQSTWLIGGEDGRVQLVNRDGEPELELKNQLFEDQAETTPATLIAGGYSKAAEQWLVGTNKGVLTGLNTTLDPITNENATFSGTAIAGIVGNPDENAASNMRWAVAGGDKVTYFPGNTPVVFAGETFSSLNEANGTLVAGTESGRVAIWDFDALDDTPTWIDALEGEAVQAAFWNGADWVILGEQGSARLISDGSAQGQIAHLGDGTALVSARWANERWLFATANGLIFETDASLNLLFNYNQPLDGATLRDSAPGKDLVVVAGDEGKYAILTPRGERMGDVHSVAGSSMLYAAEWSGSNFIVAGDQGIAQLLDENGDAIDAPITLLEGNTIRTASWSGNVWLIAGDGGKTQRVRPDGEVIGTQDLEGFAQINALKWSGSEWLAVGFSDENEALVQRIKSDGTPIGNLLTFTTIESFNAIEWSGREWIVGGSGGFVQIISNAGEPRTQPGPQPRNVLLGADIHSIDFHDNKYLVAGENGLTLLITQDLLTSVPPVAVVGLETIYEARWTRARGYGQGECLTNDLCYAGECIGNSIQTGFCCDRACDRACESCLASDTGGQDGICAPIPAGEMPAKDGCTAEDPSTCGQTGLCDGAGECALHGTDVSCSDASCEAGAVTPEGLCDGAGTCNTPEAVMCSPYLTCDGADCGTTCSSDDECSEGYECGEEGTCVTEMEEMEEMPEPETPPEEGCCAVVAPKSSQPKSLLFAALGLLGAVLLRRRRRQG